jgi:TRAP-type mannitol/chloroaromatic compound transport system substrate-binding protein
VWDQILEKKSAENPMFKEIVASQRAFAERAVKWEQDTMINRRMAMNHFFGPKKAEPKKA